MAEVDFHLAITATCARAFSLIGPYASWMDEAKSFRQPGQDIGGPMNIDEGYRWNLPVVTYGFDASFLEYFRSNGVAEAERAIDVFNSLPLASQLDPASYPTRVIRVNSQAASQGLIDLKSVTMFLLIEHLGLAEPQRFTFCLRNSVQTADGFQDAVIQRNFDPITLQPSSNLNDTAFAYSVWHSEDSSRADAIESAADPSQPVNSAVADRISAPGQFFIGLSRDDVGGLRYLLSTNAVKYECLRPGVRGEGINASSWVDGATRPGVDKITFVRQPFDARLWLVFGSSTNQSSHIFEWPISGKASALFVLQASTDLITWKSLSTNSNDGSVFTYFQWFPTSQQRFYRIVSD